MAKKKSEKVLYDRIMELREKGMSWKAISRELGITETMAKLVVKHAEGG